MLRIRIISSALAAVAFVVGMLVISPARSQFHNVCYDLLEPIWNPPTYTDVVECVSAICLVMPHCCLPTCRLHPECTVVRTIMERPGFWQYTSCEVLPVEKILDLFLRGQIRDLDDAVVPGVQQAAYAHVLALKAQAIPLQAGLQTLFERLLTSQIGAGLPAFNMGHVQRVLILPRATATASLYLRPGFNGITLNDLVILRNDIFAALTGTAIPSNPTLADMMLGGSLVTLAYPFQVLSHELVHVRQYDQLGPDAFLNNYLLETLTKGYGSDTFEREADAFEAAVENALNVLPPVPSPPANSCQQGCRDAQELCRQSRELARVCAQEYRVCMAECRLPD